MQPYRLPSITLSVSPRQSVQRGKLNANAAGAVNHAGPPLQLSAQIASEVIASDTKANSSRPHFVEIGQGHDKAAGSSERGDKLDRQAQEAVGTAGASHVQAMITAFDPNRQVQPHIGELDSCCSFVSGMHAK